MKLRKYIIPVLSLLLVSCGDYEAINTNSTGVTDEELGTLMYGTRLMEMQQKVIPIGSPAQTTGPGNDLAVSDVMSSGNYIGYFGMNNNWSFNTEATWTFADNRMEYANQVLYSNLFKPWNELNNLVKDSAEPTDVATAALANIIKITGWLRATDAFGPIVYSQAGKGEIAPMLDSQETVYRTMLADLASASATLNQYASRLLAESDLVYGGDMSKWVKLANSLMLRMAVRSHFADQALAKQYIDIALDPNNGGIIEAMADEAKLQSTTNFPLLNPFIATIDYNELRMGLTIWSYLEGYSDPREAKWFTRITYNGYPSYSGLYMGLPPTNMQGKATGTNTAEFASKPDIDGNTPIYWFRASETYFLRAEAALYGLCSGDPKQLYEDGVKMAFEEAGVGGASTYLLISGRSIPAITSSNNIYARGYTENISDNNVSPRWDDSGTTEKKLQQIITQKYLALYPNAVEAWTEYRRTGYPFILKPMDTDAPGRIGADFYCRAPERFSYAASAYTTNSNMNKVPELLGGDDKGATKLWWVRSDRPKQPQY